MNKSTPLMPHVGSLPGECVVHVALEFARLVSAWGRATIPLTEFPFWVVPLSTRGRRSPSDGFPADEIGSR